MGVRLAERSHGRHSPGSCCPIRRVHLANGKVHENHFDLRPTDAIHGYAGTITNFHVSSLEKPKIPQGGEALVWFALKSRGTAEKQAEFWLSSLGEPLLGIDPKSGLAHRFIIDSPKDEKTRRPAVKVDVTATNSQTKISDPSVFDIPEFVLERLKEIEAAEAKEK